MRMNFNGQPDSSGWPGGVIVYLLYTAQMKFFSLFFYPPPNKGFLASNCAIALGYLPRKLSMVGLTSFSQGKAACFLVVDLFSESTYFLAEAYTGLAFSFMLSKPGKKNYDLKYVTFLTHQCHRTGIPQENPPVG